ncbi:MAG: RsfS/YbeB/iojap family protein, partial [Lachnospiraceae bacterium]|nr:RsfS/YbeB/iojap family protein [Lachnospiraceae bacterium]
MNHSTQMVTTVVHALQEKKAQDIKALDISALSDIGDAFVIASASNSNQLSAL